MRAATILATACACAALTAPALAAVNLQTTVSSRVVEVGETFYVKLSALSDRSDQTPANPRLATPPGINASRPSVGSQTQMTIANGQMQQRIGLNATWQLTATRSGRFRIGPASVEAGGGRVQGEVLTVEVVPAGSRPRRAQPGSPGFDPFDLLDPLRRGRRFPFPFGLDEPDPNPEPPPPQHPPDFTVDAAPDPVAFLRATLTPADAVVGEQVTLRVYAYGSRGPFNEAHLSTEPSRGDFIGYQLGDRHDRVMYQVPIDDTIWFAAKVREYALFPIRAGTLEAGKMKFGFDGPRYGSQGPFQGLVRTCEAALVRVNEPPLKGRPAGYKLGDVGDYELTAKVEPRALTQGESVSVVAKLEGLGNVPAKLRIPERRGLVWGEPSVIDKVEPNGDVVQGFRVFTYVVRVDEAGSVDLGELTLPFWNPRENRYRVARAALGKVEVEPNPRAAAKTELKAERDPLRDVVSIRKALTGQPEAPSYVGDRPWYWALLLLGPLGVLLGDATVRASRRLREKARARKQTPERMIGEALRQAAAAIERADPASTAGAIERALFTAIESASGLKARAVLKSELPRTLSDHGFAGELAERTRKVLEQCDSLRFTGSAEPGVARELLSEAREVAEKLRKDPGARGRVGN